MFVVLLLLKLGIPNKRKLGEVPTDFHYLLIRDPSSIFRNNNNNHHHHSFEQQQQPPPLL